MTLSGPKNEAASDMSVAGNPSIGNPKISRKKAKSPQKGGVTMTNIPPSPLKRAKEQTFGAY